MKKDQEPFLTYYNVMDGTKSIEDNIKKIWTRNVFFIGAFFVLYVFVSLWAICNRIKEGYFIIESKLAHKNYTYVRKVSKKRFIEFLHQLVDQNIWKTFGCMLFFGGMFVGKFIYHVGVISYWIFNHILKPLAWMLIALFAAKTIGDAIRNK
jgi:hypothetical protein